MAYGMELAGETGDSGIKRGGLSPREGTALPPTATVAATWLGPESYAATTGSGNVPCNAKRS